MHGFHQTSTRRQFGCRCAAFCVGVGTVANLIDDLYGAKSNQMEHLSTHGIADIRLLTTKLDEQHRFYEKVLGLPVALYDNELIVTAGATRIVFQGTSKADGAPFYHFAFNIPENKLALAQSWQKERTQLIQRGGKDIVDFARWNAHSIFFNDPAGNILEYIARHDLKNAAKGVFSPADILYASEIGLVVDSIPQTVKMIREELGLDVYRDNSEAFASIGDEHALLILVKRDRLWAPDKTRAAKAHPLVAAIRGLKPASFTMRDFDYRIHIDPALTDVQRRLMAEAIGEARKGAESGGVPVGCVLAKGERIIARGRNRRIQDGDPIMHAEIACLRSVLKQGGRDACKGAAVYSTGMPCEMCAGALVHWGVKELFAARLDGAPDTRVSLESRGVQVVEVSMEEPQKLIRQFQARLNK